MMVGMLPALSSRDEARSFRPTILRAALWTATLVAVTGVITALVWLEWEPLQRLDDTIVTAAVTWTTDHPNLQEPLDRIGVTSGKRILWPLSAMLAAMLWIAGRRYEGLLIALAVAATTVVTGGIKRTLARDRPEWYIPEDPLPTASFPSGHVSLWVGFVVALGIVLSLLLQGHLPARIMRLTLAPLGVLLVVISLQRILQGRHFPSDVLVGAFVGAGCALASWVLLELIVDRWSPPDGRRDHRRRTSRA